MASATKLFHDQFQRWRTGCFGHNQPLLSFACGRCVNEHPAGYTNLLDSFGLLHTIAGNGFGGVDGVNYWQPGFEGGYATNAALSRPHFAMADEAGNVFIVDKDSHSVLKVTPNGRIHTVAGTHVAGNGPGYPTNALTVQLNAPNGIWVRPDGTVYVLDTGNGKIRRLDTNRIMATLVTVTNGINTGRVSG